eukprot:CAMPEP_0203765102 /NCGR_PEP_ID=MMETSP0098-20131031/18230_1 /ASSEMBLY_ACC=CAM_ASM_000208 /TAXON_ID=96639 /ORGANISM=" , Strain NY0313808BC1" /LENGTH=278 /DNA_ID=CAMNT_0050661325 /DNA_START=533 /DNA_END=1366 /DNA_ORIENTATION=+
MPFLAWLVVAFFATARGEYSSYTITDHSLRDTNFQGAINVWITYGVPGPTVLETNSKQQRVNVSYVDGFLIVSAQQRPVDIYLNISRHNPQLSSFTTQSGAVVVANLGTVTQDLYLQSYNGGSMCLYGNITDQVSLIQYGIFQGGMLEVYSETNYTLPKIGFSGHGHGTGFAHNVGLFTTAYVDTVGTAMLYANITHSISGQALDGRGIESYGEAMGVVSPAKKSQMGEDSEQIFATSPCSVAMKERRFFKSIAPTTPKKRQGFDTIPRPFKTPAQQH